MSNEFAQSNAALDAAIAKCTNAEEIREITKAAMAASGVITRDVETQLYGVSLNPRQPEPTPDTSLPANGFRFEREFRFAPGSGRRTLMLRANTLDDLNALERQMERTI
jgi:hypothetical protein